MERWAYRFVKQNRDSGINPASYGELIINKGSGDSVVKGQCSQYDPLKV